MTELYVIRIRHPDKKQDGYLGDLTNLSDDNFSIMFLRPSDLHSCFNDVVALFSRRKAETLRDEVLAKIHKRYHGVTGDVEEHKFSNEKVQQVMHKGYVFRSQRDDD